MSGGRHDDAPSVENHVGNPQESLDRRFRRIFSILCMLYAGADERQRLITVVNSIPKANRPPPPLWRPREHRIANHGRAADFVVDEYYSGLLEKQHKYWRESMALKDPTLERGSGNGNPGSPAYRKSDADFDTESNFNLPDSWGLLVDNGDPPRPWARPSTFPRTPADADAEGTAIFIRDRDHNSYHGARRPDQWQVASGTPRRSVGMIWLDPPTPTPREAHREHWRWAGDPHSIGRTQIPSESKPGDDPLLGREDLIHREIPIPHEHPGLVRGQNSLPELGSQSIRRFSDDGSTFFKWAGKVYHEPPMHRLHTPRADIYRVACVFADFATLLIGGIATIAILNFNQARGTCPAPEVDSRWAMVVPLLKYLPRSIICPNLRVYLAGVSTYSVVGVFHITQEPRYLADCGLVAVILSVLTGALCGGLAMVDALVLGGFLSLVCCKALQPRDSTRSRSDSRKTDSWVGEPQECGAVGSSIRQPEKPTLLDF